MAFLSLGVFFLLWNWRGRKSLKNQNLASLSRASVCDSAFSSRQRFRIFHSKGTYWFLVRYTLFFRDTLKFCSSYFFFRNSLARSTKPVGGSLVRIFNSFAFTFWNEKEEIWLIWILLFFIKFNIFKRNFENIFVLFRMILQFYENVFFFTQRRAIKWNEHIC